MTREEALKGLDCCAEFECGECPYKIYSHIDYKFRCNYKLISDLKTYVLRTGTWMPETDEEEPNPMFKHVVCSNCGGTSGTTFKFCPHCGMKMFRED